MSYAMETGPRTHLINVDEYYRMAEVGLLAPDARVELIEGVITDMLPAGTNHATVVAMLTTLLIETVGRAAIVRPQLPVRLSLWSEPEPDIAVGKPRPDWYRLGHPAGFDLFLAIEVSDSSLRYDLDTKSKVYARHGVPEFWVVDIKSETVHFFRKPAGVSYDEVISTHRPAVVTLPSLELPINLASLFDDPYFTGSE